MLIINKMQRLSFDFVDVNIYVDTFMWPSVNRNVLTNWIDIRSAKTHDMTSYKQAQKDSENL